MSRFTTPIHAIGPAANIYAIVGVACAHMRHLDIAPPDIEAFKTRVRNAQSYRNAVDIVREWFPVLGVEED